MVPIRYVLFALLLLGAGLLTAIASDSPSMSDQRARMTFTWMVERGDHTYRLRGRYTITSSSGEFTTSVASDGSLDAAVSSVDVPTGLYSVTLEAGFTLERIAARHGAASHGATGFGAAPEPTGGAFVEPVPASLVSPNPVTVVAQQGRTAPVGLSLVNLSGAPEEHEASCMYGA
jgi:hypothetical protein